MSIDLKSLQDELKTVAKRNQQLTSRWLENTDPERVKHRYTVPQPEEFRYYYEEELKGATVMLADGTTFVIEGITSDYYESAVISRNPSEEYNKKYDEWVIVRDQWVDNTINAFILCCE